jgi:hypothetical protein
MKAILTALVLAAPAAAEVYTRDWGATFDAGQSTGLKVTNGGIGDTIVFNNVGSSHDIFYFTCPANTAKGSQGNSPRVNWACPSGSFTDTSVYTELSVVNGQANFTVTTKFGGGAQTEGLCFFCSKNNHCANGMRLVAVADNGPKCSIDYLSQNMGNSIASGKALSIQTSAVACTTPGQWKASGGSTSCAITDADGKDCGSYVCGKSDEDVDDPTAGKWVYSKPHREESCAVSDSILGAPSAGGAGGGSGNGAAGGGSNTPSPDTSLGDGGAAGKGIAVATAALAVMTTAALVH